MDGKVELIGKEALMAKSGYHPGKCLEGLKNKHEKLVR
jgi:hypothetical protein